MPAIKPNVPPRLPHQEHGIQFLRERSEAALLDEQGLGKSRQVIEAIKEDIAEGVLEGALIVCPNTIKQTWAEEIERYSDLRYAIFGSGKQARRLAFQSLRAAFYVINYEAVIREMPSLRALLRFKRMALALDESHRIKTPTARITKAIHSLRSESAKRIILSGTPVANKPEDLWSQYYFLDDGESLGTTFEDFQTRYCTASGGYSQIDDLRVRLRPLSLRREKRTSVSLPDKRIVRVQVNLATRQAEMYNDLRTDLELWIRNMSGEEILEQAENILTRLLRLAQIASNPSLIDSSYLETPSKYLVLDELLAGYLEDPRDKVIIWTSFVGNIAALRRRFTHLAPVTLHGALSSDQKQRSIREFKQNSQVRLMIANPAAAREGLTLTEAHTAIYVDRTFNLVDYLQSQDRIHRLSQSHECEIVLLIASATIDEYVDFSIEQKLRLARYTQSDTHQISPGDLALQKPDLLRALVEPVWTE